MTPFSPDRSRDVTMVTNFWSELSFIRSAGWEEHNMAACVNTVDDPFTSVVVLGLGLEG